MYEVDYIKARRLVRGHAEYLIKWKNFEVDKYDTWEPIANLSGLEQDLATFEAKQRKEQEEFAKQMAANIGTAKKAAMLPGNASHRSENGSQEHIRPTQHRSGMNDVSRFSALEDFWLYAVRPEQWIAPCGGALQERDLKRRDKDGEDEGD